MKKFVTVSLMTSLGLVAIAGCSSEPVEPELVEPETILDVSSILQQPGVEAANGSTQGGNMISLTLDYKNEQLNWESISAAACEINDAIVLNVQTKPETVIINRDGLEAETSKYVASGLQCDTDEIPEFANFLRLVESNEMGTTHLWGEGINVESGLIFDLERSAYNELTQTFLALTPVSDITNGIFFKTTDIPEGPATSYEDVKDNFTIFSDFIYELKSSSEAVNNLEVNFSSTEISIIAPNGSNLAALETLANKYAGERTVTVTELETL